MRHKHAFLLFFFLLAALFISGCAEETNLLRNPRFEAWKGLPEGWVFEGPGSVRHAEDIGAEILSDDGAPFLYQKITVGSRYKGKPMTFSAWVRTDVEGSIVVEFSDRKGQDIKSSAHPGDGQWRLLSVTVNLPSSSDEVELRLRNYKKGSAFVKEAAATPGNESSLAMPVKPADRAAASYKEAALLVLIAAWLSIIFKRRGAPYPGRLMETSAMLLAVSAALCFINKGFHAGLSHKLGWGVFVSGIGSFALLKAGKEGREALASFYKRPGSSLISLSLLMLVLVVFELRSGDVNGAGGYARASYILMLAGAAVAGLKKAFKKGIYAQTYPLEKYRAGRRRLSGRPNEECL